jgi:flagellar biogenesis protein FliO
MDRNTVLYLVLGIVLVLIYLLYRRTKNEVARLMRESAVEFEEAILPKLGQAHH